MGIQVFKTILGFIAGFFYIFSHKRFNKAYNISSFN